MLSFNKTGMAGELVVFQDRPRADSHPSLLSTPSATVPRIPVGGAWLPASRATVAQCSLTHMGVHTQAWCALWAEPALAAQRETGSL